jgi:predicted nucleic acid-binding protein
VQALYLDSSAIVKLVAAEAESPALFDFVRQYGERLSSVLARVEVHRAVRRAGGSAAERRRADRVLARLALVRIDDPIIAMASQLRPTDLRSLDAIHLATALSTSDALAGFVTYDARLARAATAARLEVFQPE